jgi:hypothetical protein
VYWVAKTLLAIVFLLGLAALGGVAYQTIGTRMDARRSPEHGKLVDIGGYRLKINCVGTLSPTVVLESGLGDVSPEWERVQPGIAEFSRVCSYDRAGYGGSDAGPMPRSSAVIAKELHTLLQWAGEKPPFVLVGQLNDLRQPADHRALARCHGAAENHAALLDDQEWPSAVRALSSVSRIGGRNSWLN